jgi:hypothetical protein
VELIGDGIGIELSPAEIDFGTLLGCLRRDTAVRIINGADSAVLSVTGYRITGDGAAFRITPQPPFQVPPSGELELRVEFLPPAAGTYAATVSLENEQGIPLELRLRGTAGVVRLLVGDGALHDRVLPGTEVRVTIPVRTEPRPPVTVDTTFGLCLRVQYPAEFLEFQRWALVQDAPGWSWQVQPVGVGELELRGSGRSGWLFVPPVVIGLDFLVYLHLPPEQEVRLSLCPGTEVRPCMEPVIQNPRVRIADVCFLNGRQVRLVSEAAAMQVEPNPAVRGTPLRAHFWLAQPETVAIELFTPMGSAVFEQRMELPAGSHQILVPTHELSAGVYFYRLWVGAAVQTGSFVLLP